MHAYIHVYTPGLYLGGGWGGALAPLYRYFAPP